MGHLLISGPPEQQAFDWTEASETMPKVEEQINLGGQNLRTSGKAMCSPEKEKQHKVNGKLSPRESYDNQHQLALC